MTEDMKIRCQNYIRHFSSLLEIPCYLLDIEENEVCHQSGLDFCKHCDFASRGVLNTHSYGFNEACRWNGKYIYSCPAGLFWSAATVGTNANDGAIIAGPLVLNSYEDAIDLIGIMSDKMKQFFWLLPVLTSEQLNDVCEVLAAGALGISLVKKEYFWLDLELFTQKELNKTPHSDVIYKTIEYIKQHYLERISLEEIASHVGLSRTYLSTTFKKETGMALYNFVNVYRVEISKNLLLNTNISLIDVAGRSGFSDQSYFTRIFKKLTGVSPQKFRNYRGNI